MAVTISLYNDVVQRFVNGSLSASDTYKLELLNDSATFVAANTTKTQVDSAGAYEVSGNGWAVGGQTLTGVTTSLVNTNDAMFDANDIEVTATGGAIGPAYKALLYNSTDSTLVAFIDFGAAKTADTGTPFKVTWDPAGIVSFTYTPA